MTARTFMLVDADRELDMRGAVGTIAQMVALLPSDARSGYADRLAERIPWIRALPHEDRVQLVDEFVEQARLGIPDRSRGRARDRDVNILLGVNERSDLRALIDQRGVAPVMQDPAERGKVAELAAALTGARRVWALIDDETKTVWVDAVFPVHPSQTDT